MSKRAVVAYEAPRRKLAVRPLRWHRSGEGRYEAKGKDGVKYLVLHRTPDRRNNKYPWLALKGGVRGVELKVGGFDTASDAKDFAAKADVGLCGAPAVVVQAPSPQGLPPGVYRGTAMGEARRSGAGNPLNTYFEKVDVELQKMGFDPGQASTMSADSTEYVSRMFDAKVDPAITAAVLVATKGHHHTHNCPEKHVELAEGGAREDRAGGDTYKVQYKDMTGVTWVDFVQAGGVDDAERIARKHAERMWHPVHSAVGVSLASEEEKKRQPYMSWVDWVDAVEVVLSERGLTAFVPSTLFRDLYIKGRTPSEAVDVAIQKGEATSYEGGAAEESRKRLPQPDPSSGYYITHSSLTRDLWLMHEDRLVARSTDRGELLRKAEQLSESSEAAEARRPKGRRHR